MENPTTIVDPNQAPGVIDPNQAPGGEHGYGLAVDAFNPSDVEEGPEELGGPIPHGGHDHRINPTPESATQRGTSSASTRSTRQSGADESVGIHEVDEQPAPDRSDWWTQATAVGFNPQPDPPGTTGLTTARYAYVGRDLVARSQKIRNR